MAGAIAPAPIAIEVAGASIPRACQTSQAQAIAHASASAMPTIQRSRRTTAVSTGASVKGSARSVGAKIQLRDMGVRAVERQRHRAGRAGPPAGVLGLVVLEPLGQDHAGPVLGAGDRI